MNKQEYIDKTKVILFKHRANDRGNKHLNLLDDREELQKQDNYYAEKLFSLFLDMAEGMIPESKTLHGNFHTYVCDHIDEESEIKHPIQITHQCFVVDQFKEKIEELKGGEK